MSTEPGDIALHDNYGPEASVVARARSIVAPRVPAVPPSGQARTLRGTIEQTFDPFSKAVSHVYASGALPVVLGGDHSIGYPAARVVAEHLGGGDLATIHFGHRVDTRGRLVRAGHPLKPAGIH
jgi:arginase family enzyme